MNQIFKKYIFKDYFESIYPDVRPYMLRKISRLFFSSIVSLIVSVLYLITILANSNQVTENPFVFLIMISFLMVNLYLIDRGNYSFTIPIYTFVLVQSQFGYFLRLPIGYDMVIISMFSFVTMIWVFISYKTWHMFVPLANVIVVTISRGFLIFNSYSDGNITNDQLVAYLNSYGLLIVVVLIGFAVFINMEKEVLLFEKEQIENRIRNERIGLIANIISTKDFNKNMIDLKDYDKYFDPLTGLLNTLAYNEFLSVFVDKIKKDKDVYSIAFCDLNNLKRVNDVYGHKMGDLYIKALSEGIKTYLGVELLPFRVGGDEFVILFLHNNSDMIISFFESVQEQLFGKTRSYGFDGTFSYGFTTSDESNEELSLEELIHRADKRMYEMKSKFAYK